MWTNLTKLGCNAILLCFSVCQGKQHFSIAWGISEVLLPLLHDHCLNLLMSLQLRFIALLCQFAEQIDEYAGYQCHYEPLENEWQDIAINVLQEQQCDQ